MVHGYYVEVGPMIEAFVPKGVAFYYVCGGRGLGKTYSALDVCWKLSTGEYKIEPTHDTAKFLYLRKTGVIAKSTTELMGNVFKKYNQNEGVDVVGEFNGQLGMGYFYSDKEKENIIGYSAAVSTFSNLRGVDFSDVDFIFYDEIIPDNTTRNPIKNEGRVLMNLYETVNRNRELEGLAPCVMLMASNPIDLSYPLLSELNITPILNNMIFRHQQKYTDYERSLHIERYREHQVSKDKAAGALYKFSQGTQFYDEALSGEFVNNDLGLIKKVSLIEYVPIIQVENVYIYQHKGDSTLYASQVKAPCKHRFKAAESAALKRTVLPRYRMALEARNIYYDSFDTKVVLEAMLRYTP